MLQAFKSRIGTLYPFNNVVMARKDISTIIKIKYIGENKHFEFYCASQEDRDQQLANFEKWLTTKTNSI